MEQTVLFQYFGWAGWVLTLIPVVLLVRLFCRRSRWSIVRMVLVSLAGVFVAALMLYSGQPDKALSMLDERQELRGKFNHTYLRMRCCEELSLWSDFENHLLDLLLDREGDVAHNASTIHHRKDLWTVLTHPQFVTSETLSAAGRSLKNDIRMDDSNNHFNENTLRLNESSL